ncbi:MAG TPA: asparagine synthase (glutamine-hydrolyzing), partial [Bacteroidia bacterium]
GIWNLNGEKVPKEVLVRFTDSLAHRGPDGSGYYIDDSANIGLGHRRLSILDLSENGSQPMSYGNERYWISYNGEVFNFIELRKELVQKGFSFKSNSDTEIILAAYSCWGKDCLLKFNGMWALAVWDKQEQTLFLARDRFGIKPLYYLHRPGKCFAFSSETGSFKRLEGYQRSIDRNNMTLVLNDNLALIGNGYTVFENIYQLLPGHFILLGKNSIPRQQRWWSTLEHRVKTPSTYAEQVEQFSEIFEDACRIQMRSDVPIASALSGGVDSSSVNCMIYHLMNGSKDKSRIPENWQNSFFAYFKDTDQDEKYFAEEVIHYVKSKATIIETDYTQMAMNAERSAIDFDDVSGSPIVSICDTYRAMHKAGLKVSIDGHGPDEMLYGYPFMVREAYRWAVNRNKAELAEDIAETYVGLFGESVAVNPQNDLNAIAAASKKKLLKRLAGSFVPDSLRSYLKSQNVSSHQVKINSWLKNKEVKSLQELSGSPEKLFLLNDLDRSVYRDFHYGMLQGLLRDFDRASMQNHIEIRMPFMDWRLVTFVFSLPIESKIGHGFTKRILRDSMKGKMPENIRTRKLKMGFSAPLVNFFTTGMKQYVMDKVSSRRFIESDLWDGRSIQECAVKHFENNSWQWSDCSLIWKFINADLINSAQ